MSDRASFRCDKSSARLKVVSRSASVSDGGKGLYRLRKNSFFSKFVDSGGSFRYGKLSKKSYGSLVGDPAISMQSGLYEFVSFSAACVAKKSDDGLHVVNLREVALRSQPVMVCS